MITWLRNPIGLVSVVVVIACVIGGVWYAGRGSSGGRKTAASSQPVPVQVVQAKTAPISSILAYSGAITASQQVNLAPRISGQLASIVVDVGTAVKAGDTLATLDLGILPAQLLQAQATLQSAQARLSLMLDGPRSFDVAAAAAALNAAQARLNQIQNPLRSDLSAQTAVVQAAQTALANGKVAVDNTKNSLGSAISLYCNIYNAAIVTCSTPMPIPQKDMDDLQQLLRSNSIWAFTSAGSAAVAMTTANANYNTAVNNVANLAQTLASAQDKYELLLSPSASDVAAQQSLVATAQANLDNKNLPYTDADTAGQRAVVAAAQASVAAAKTSVDQTSIKAPFEGLVAQKLLDVGATVSAQTPVFVMVAKAVEIHVTVDEARIGLMRPSMVADITVPAFPTRTFKGKVATISPLGDARAHTFDVKVLAEDPDRLLQPGMFAQVNIVVATKANAIIVPTAAIVQQGTSSRVFVIVSGKASQKTVKVGIADALNSEITEGVAAGDQVVTVGQNVVRDGQAVQVSTPGAGGGARPSGTAGASGASGAQGGAPAGSPAATGTAAQGRPSATATGTP